MTFLIQHKETLQVDIIFYIISLDSKIFICKNVVFLNNFDHFINLQKPKPSRKLRQMRKAEEKKDEQRVFEVSRCNFILYKYVFKKPFCTECGVPSNPFIPRNEFIFGK